MAKEKGSSSDTEVDFQTLIAQCGKGVGLIPLNLQRSTHVADCISSGSLCFDLITGGGLAPGRWTTVFGAEGSAKSTLIFQAVADAALKMVQSLYFDAEGAADGLYMDRIYDLRGTSLLEMFGVKKKEIKGKKGNGASKAKKGEVLWSKKPTLTYYAPDFGEQVFRFIRQFLEGLPDKSGGRVQAVFYIDSLASMLSQALALDPESGQNALDAAMFSKNFKLVKSLLRRKWCSVLATNQLRVNPRAKYGNPEYEPGGNAPKHYSDCRVRLQAVSSPWKKTIHEEVGWEGTGVDRYRYITLSTIKNKSYSPFKKSLLRVWFDESGMGGRGLCPVWDTFQYLTHTGQIKKIGHGAKEPGYESPLVVGGDEFLWGQFKQLILAPEWRDDSNSIREMCWKQMASGEAFKLYADTEYGASTHEETPEPDEPQVADHDPKESTITI